MDRITTRFTRRADRSSYWQAAVSRVFAPCRIDVDPAFRGTISNTMAGPISCHLVSAGRHRAERSRDDIFCYGSDVMVLSLMLSGVQEVTQDGREIELREGDFAIHDLGRPYGLKFDTDFSQYIFQIPSHMLRRRLGGFEHFTACRMSATDGLGGMTSRFFVDLARIGPVVSPVVSRRLADQAVELLAMTIEDQAGADGLGASSHRTALLYRAKLFIEDHLRDTIDTSDVARHLGCSSRYVHSLFSDEQSSVRQYVLVRRLQRCREELALTADSARRVSDVAYAWGFSNASYFSRAFRAYYGTSPSKCRKADLK